MKIKKYILQTISLIGIIFYVQPGYSQDKEYLDYIITKNNDTIYGTFKNGLIGSYLQLFNDSGTTDVEKYVKHSLKDVKGYRYNDFFSSVEAKDDGVYVDLGQKEDFSKDYVVTAAGDTIHTRIYEQTLGAPYYSKDGNKQKIKGPDFVAYRKSNLIYEFREKTKVYNYDKKQAFLLLMLKSGNIALYGYRGNIGVCYYLEKDGVSNLIYSENYREQCKLLLGDNIELMDLINNNVYSYENLYLAVKYYIHHSDKE